MNKIKRPRALRSISHLIIVVVAATITSHGQTRPAVNRAFVQPATIVGRYRLQSNPWINLQERLFNEIRFKEPAPAALAGDDLVKWQKAVEEYRVFLGKRNPLSDVVLIRLSLALSATNTSKLPASIPEAAAKALAAAMPLYRSAQWEQDERGNRFWIALAEPLLASAGEELAAANAKAYATPFPTHILVDVSALAGEFGAYTVGEPDSAHVILASTDPANQGFRALEALMHEPSHVIVDSNVGTIGGDIKRIAEELNVKPRYNLWHAILFYTTGELTRRAYARRGITDFKPMITLMYERGFQGFRQPLETH